MVELNSWLDSSAIGLGPVKQQLDPNTESYRKRVFLFKTSIIPPRTP